MDRKPTCAYIYITVLIFMYLCLYLYTCAYMEAYRASAVLISELNHQRDHTLSPTLPLTLAPAVSCG